MNIAQQKFKSAQALSGDYLETIGLQGGSRKRKFVPIVTDDAIAIHLNGSDVPSRIVRAKDFHIVLQFRAGLITAREAHGACVVTSYVCGMLKKLDA